MFHPDHEGSNVRVEPDGALQCTLHTVQTIRVGERRGAWYATDACGSAGWIHQSQLHVYRPGTVRASTNVFARPDASSTITCHASGGVRILRTQGAWLATDYCNGDVDRASTIIGWVRASEVVFESTRAVEASAGAVRLTTAAAPTCSATLNCTGAGVVPICADAASAACINGRCVYNRSATSTCACYVGEVEDCPSAAGQFAYCTSSAPNTAAWQATCGPSSESCDPHRVGCTGHDTTRYDSATRAWVAGTCAADPGCPADGDTRKCTTGNPACPDGLTTYSGAAGWSGCAPIGSCIVAPPPPPIFVVDPTGGPTINIGSATCFGSISTGGPRPMQAPAVREESTGVVTTLENGGSLALALASSFYKGARVRLTFKGDRGSEVTRIQFVSVTRHNITMDATLGTLVVTNGVVALQTDDAGTIALTGTTKELERLVREANLHCGRTIVLGARLAPTSFRVDDYWEFVASQWREP